MTLPEWIPAWSTAKGYVLGALASAALCLPLGYCTGHDAGVAEEQAKYAKAAQDAELIEEQSEGEAARERESDTTEIETAREARDDAIENATDQAGDARPSAASNAANCERLRRAGTDVSQLPACAGRAGGAETRSRP